MIVCSCAVITDNDIEMAVFELMSIDNALIPTPGVVYRHLSKKMNCCGCAPIAVETIYEKMSALEERGLICPCACDTTQNKLLQFKPAEKLKSRRHAALNEDTSTKRPLTGRHSPKLTDDSKVV